ncbi:MAG: hypothetical protein PHS41_06600 [Victivallaceae bacterium]|nr:hypothetical protein [Victivallaceae bacterium]
MKKSALIVAALTAATAAFCAESFTLERPGEWVFRRGDAAEAKIDETSGEIVCRSFEGKNVPLTVRQSPDGKSRLIQLPTSDCGYYVLTNPANKKRQSFAVVPPVPAHDTFENPFGVNYHLTRIALSDAKREVRMAQFIGLDWARGVLFDWSSVRDGSGKALFAKYAALRDFLKESKLHCLGGLYYVPQEISSAPEGVERLVATRCPPEDMTPGKVFAKQLAKEYDFIRYWEVGNEPDADLFWRGRWRNYIRHDERAVIGDYVDYLAAAYQGFKEADPKNVVLLGGLTSHGPVGYTWKPFWKTALEAGCWKYFDVLNVHYAADIGLFRKMMLDAGGADRPCWLTETGGSAAGGADNERTQVVRDVTEQVAQLSAGAVKVMKYDFRNDGTNPLYNEHHFGMVRRDFSPKPTYVAHAVMIAKLLNTRPVAELNVLKSADRGFLKGFAFAHKDGSYVNVLWLNLAKKAKVKLAVGSDSLTYTSALGVQKVLRPDATGHLLLEVDDLPFYLEGVVKSAPGKIVYPADTLVKRIALPLKNAAFENRKLESWHSLFDKTVSRTSCAGGTLRVEVSAPGFKQYLPIFQHIDIAKFMEDLPADCYVRLVLSCRTKRENIVGRGTTLCGSFLDGARKRVAYRDGGYRAGTHDWQLETLLSKPLPPQTRTIGVEYYFAPKTTGKIEVDDFRAELEVWKKPQL